MNDDIKGTQSSSYRRTQGPQHQRKPRSKGSKDGQSSGPNKTGTWKKELAKHRAADDAEDTELCIICAEKLKYVALSPCSHKTCHVCAFRQRALYGKKACLICRTEIEKVVFTDNLEKDFDGVKGIAVTNEEYGIEFTRDEIAKTTLDLLKFTCSICDKSQETDFGNFKKLNEHIKSSHSKTICMICASNKHAFPIELRIYTPNQLRNHQSKGDSEGFKGHPMCAFCTGMRFYSDDELYMHMRHHHEKCHICEKIDPSSPQYFKDYDQLFEHFKNCHYICTHPTCLENKFVVFRDEIELQAHILKEHGDMIRGRPKLFQSELSTFVSAPSRVIRECDSYDIPSGSSSSRQKSSSETPEIKKLRLQERARFYLGNSSEKMRVFDKLNEDFDSGKINSKTLFDSYENMFTSPDADIYLLIHNLSELYPTSSQKFKELDKIYKTYEDRLNRNQELPSLSRDPSSSVSLVNGVWSANNNTVSTSHGRGINTAKLPSLMSQPSRDPFASPLRSSSYKNLTQPKKKTPTPVIRTASSTNTVNFTPTYLDKKKKTTSSGSLNRGENKLAALDLPSLPTPKPKVYIPPLKKTVLPDPKKWGKQQSAEEPSNDTMNLTLNTRSSNERKKGRQKQLLFHIGI